MPSAAPDAAAPRRLMAGLRLRGGGGDGGVYPLTHHEMKWMTPSEMGTTGGGCHSNATKDRASEATVRAIVQANAAAPRTWGPGRLLPLHVAAVAGASAGDLAGERLRRFAGVIRHHRGAQLLLPILDVPAHLAGHRRSR